ncbi:hypothetical protein WJX73_005708 [Symbiochloris irregularis]|uniref:Uncharacterized protein n=1 Tax=Symbiochloris irregularis TaxID=706552 RepID=A0AAW1P5M9_9CHLO
MNSASWAIRPRLTDTCFRASNSCGRCLSRSASRQISTLLRCSAQAGDHDESTEPLSQLPVKKSSDEVRADNNQAEALIRSLEQVSNQQGRSASTRNVVLGDNHKVDSWRELDKKVNKYPHRRTFKAIGQGGQSFASNMQAAVENVLGPVHSDFIHQRLSKGKGNYISVTIGPCTVHNSEQVIDVYARMSKDERLKFYF